MQAQEQSPANGWPHFKLNDLDGDPARQVQMAQSIAGLSRKFTYSGAKAFPFGAPLVVRHAQSRHLKAFARAYHRMLKAILDAYSRNSMLREFLSLPGGIDTLIRLDSGACISNEVHICRLDLYTTADGGFKVLETNANCPGGLIYAGFAARALRPFVEIAGRVEDLPYASESWMADWYLRAARRATVKCSKHTPTTRQRDYLVNRDSWPAGWGTITT